MPPKGLAILGDAIPYTVVHDREYFGRSRHIMSEKAVSLGSRDTEWFETLLFLSIKGA